ncbi:hypothetical protein [Undibacterium sp. Di24W]|uniref:hypothetical protein n=1 Tax=Undibacterium sp. Di24W TaxID=3413033 RepID=UPI003BF2E9B0
MTHKAFALIMQDLRDGRVHAELTQQFGDLIQKVQETGKAGELVLKIKVKPATKGNVDKVMIADAVSVNMPKPERGEDVFFLTEDNELSRNHPRQGNLELRDATPTAPATLKEAKNG